jgi:hypothetical protein
MLDVAHSRLRMRYQTLVPRLRGSGLWPEATIVAAVVVAFHATLVGTAHLPYDAEFFHFPLLRAVQEMLSSGTLPSWDGYTYGGTPLLANAQAAWLYPPHLVLDGVLSMLGQPLTEHALDVLAVAHVGVAGLATCAVARRRGLGRAGGAFAGVFVVLSGATVSQAQHLAMTETFAWIPLAVLVIDRLGEGITVPRVTALAALFGLMVTAGFLPLIPACAALVIGTALAHGPKRLRASFGAVAGMTLGFAMAGAMIVPVVALRGTFPPLEAHGSLPTGTLVTALFPNAFGHWQASPAAYIGLGGLTSSYYYLGAGALILLPLALTSGRAAVREAVLVLALLIASFGTSATKIATTMQALPTIGHLWRPEDLAYVATVPLALLLARGLSRAPSARQLGGLALTVAVIAAIPFSDSHGHELHLLADAPRRTLLVLLLVAALVVFAHVMHARRRSSAAIALALAAIVASAELASAVPGRYFVNSAGPATSAGPHVTGDGSAVLQSLISTIAPGERIAADIGNLPPTWPGFGPIWRLPDVNGFQPQFSKYQLARVEATGADFEGRNRIFPIVPGVRPYLDEMNVGYVVVLVTHDPFVGVQGYTPVFADGIYHVYRVEGQRARAYAVDELCIRRRGVLHLLACQVGPAVRTTLTMTSVRRLQIERPTGVPLLLVTGEPWYPGWRAKSAAGQLPVRRIGYLAAVSVPRGTSEVELSYRAPGLLTGTVLSALALAGSLLAVVRARRCRGPVRGGQQRQA